MTQAKVMKEREKRSDAPDAIPPKGGGRPGLPPIVSGRVRELIEALLTKEPFVGHGAISRLAEALGVSQPAVSQIRKGGGVAPETAIKVARLTGVDPRDLLGGAYVGVAIGGKNPNLEICLGYHPGRWNEPTIAAVKAGLWTDEVLPEVWAQRLDQVQQQLGALIARPVTPPPPSRRIRS